MLKIAATVKLEIDLYPDKQHIWKINQKIETQTVECGPTARRSGMSGIRARAIRVTQTCPTSPPKNRRRKLRH